MFIAKAGERIKIEAASNLYPERVWITVDLGGYNVLQVAVLKEDLMESLGEWFARNTPAAREARVTNRVVALEAVRKDISHA